MIKEIKIFGKKIIVELRNDGDEAVFNELFLQRQYSQCESIVKSAKNTIIDIGGHIGFFSLSVFVLNSVVPVYTFEPHEENFTLLKSNLKKNRVKNVKPRQLAVSNKIEEAQLQLSKEDLNHSLIKAIEPTGDIQKVQSTTIERIFTQNRINKCDLLKLDCEGSEYDIIYSIPDNIFSKISHIFLEYHEWEQRGKSDKLKNFLITKGYNVNKYPNPKMSAIGYLWCGRKNQ